MQFLSLALTPFLLIFLQFSPALAQSNATIVTPSTSPELNKYPTPTPITSYTYQPGDQYYELLELPEGSLDPLRGPIATSGEVSSGPSDTMAQITISTQDQNSVTSSPIFTAPQPFGNSVIDNTVTQPTSSILQLASSSSILALEVIKPPNNPVAQYTSSSGSPLTAGPNLSGNLMAQPLYSIFQGTSSSSTSAVAATQIPSRVLVQSTTSINDQTSSDNILPILMPQLPSRSRAQATSSANHQTSSSSSSSPAIAVSQIPNSPISQSSSSINHQTISTNNILPIPASQLPDTSTVQSTSSSSPLATAVTQLPNNPTSQSPSSINQQSGSSFNNDHPPTQLQNLPFNTVTHTINSMGYQTSSSSSSNSNPPQILPSDSMLTDYPPAQNFPTTTLVGVPVPTAVQTVLLEVTISSAAGLGDAILAGMGILPPEASATPGEVANAAIESVSNGVEVVQIFPTTTLIVATVSSVPAAATSAVEGPIVLISAGTGIIPSGKSATLGASANSAIPSGGSVGGGDKGGGGGNGSSVITGSGTTTGSGSPTESISGQTTVPIISTGEAKVVNRWESWWLKFEMLVWGLGMVYWM